MIGIKLYLLTEEVFVMQDSNTTSLRHNSQSIEFTVPTYLFKASYLDLFRDFQNYAEVTVS